MSLPDDIRDCPNTQAKVHKLPKPLIIKQ